MTRTEDFWLGAPARIDIDPSDLKPGLSTIEVRLTVPRYVTLRVEFADECQTSIDVTLNALGGGRYRNVVSLSAPAHLAWIEALPAIDIDDAAIAISRLTLSEMALQGGRAALSHVRAPLTFLSKVRQVTQRGTSMVFHNRGSGVSDADFDYGAWQQAFEDETADRRLLQELDGIIGSRSIRILAVRARHFDDTESERDLIPSLVAGSRASILLADFASDTSPTIAQSGFEQVLTATASDRNAPGHAIANFARDMAADVVIFLDRPGRFHKLGPALLGLGLLRQPDALAAYADHDKLNAENKRTNPVFKPAWSPDYQLSSGYVAEPVGFRPGRDFLSVLDERDALKSASQRLLSAIALRISPDSCVAHVPRVLFHEQSQDRIGGKTVGIAEKEDRRPVAQAPQHAKRPHVSVIIPTKDNPALLARAWRSVCDADYDNWDVVIVDNGARTSAQKQLLEQIAADPRGQVIEHHEPFNFSRLINAGRAAATGDVLLLLNDDVEALDQDWAAELVEQALRPGIGSVGALLLYPDMRVQHAGIVLGRNGGPGHAFRFWPAEREDDGCRLTSVREVSAVTAACMAVRATVFDEAGGFCAELPVTLNDVDFGLQLRALGYRNLVAPRARLIHHEAASRGLDSTPEALRRLAREMALFRQRWGDAASDDPYVSPHLNPAHGNYRPRPI